MTDIPPAGSLTAHARSARRPELLERLIAALTSGSEADGSRLPLRDRSLGEPTIALLDAWASVADVIGFYRDRIWAEGFIATALEPGSILALAGLLGHRPRPGIAARVHLAYTLNPDPDDQAVLLPSQLLCQSVPGPGEQPQVFQTTEPLVARPSWSSLAAKSERPLSVANAADAKALAQILIGGTTSNLTANDAILLDVAGATEPVLLRVASALVDQAKQVTTVALQAPTGQAAKFAGLDVPGDLTRAIDGLMAAGLTRSAPAEAPSPRELDRSAPSTFGRSSDAIPRLLTTLQPGAAATLYPALGSSPIGGATVTGASVLRVKATPFGAQAPPRTVFDSSGQPAGTEAWPIADTVRLELQMTGADFQLLLNNVVEGPGKDPGHFPLLMLTSVLGEATGNAQLSLDSTKLPAVELGDGRLGVKVAGATATVTYAGPGLRPIEVTARRDASTDVILWQFDGSGGPTFVWDPAIRTAIRARVGMHRLSIVWSPSPDLADKEASVSLVVETPLPLVDRTIVALDACYDGILPGTSIVIERAGEPKIATPIPGTPLDDPAVIIAPAAGTIAYPVVARVLGVDRTVVTGFGSSALVTRLTLDQPWIGADVTSQAELAALTVRAQPDALVLKPIPIDEDVSGATIELARLIAGMDVGRMILVAGTRSDLPAGATVPAGEVATVAEILQGTGDHPVGDTPVTTLRLAAPLAYAYRRASLRIFANVVAAQQGATIHEILGSGLPAQAHQRFTLSSAPLLADPAPTPSGQASTLSVTVDGVPYDEVPRFDDATPARSYMTGLDAQGHTTIAFAGPLPTGSGNVQASYRAGDGSQGNARAGQVTQLLSRPAGVAGAENPLPAFGGIAGDGPEEVRAGAPLGLRGLGRVVTVSDYAELARSYAGVGKATAELAGRSPAQGVLLTIAGTDPVPLDATGPLCTSVAATVSAAADPLLPLRVVPAGLFMILLGATVTRDPRVSWDDAVGAVRAALLAGFAYSNRDLGADVVLSDLIAAAHAAPAVRSFAVTALALVPAQASASDLADRVPQLLAEPVRTVTRVRTAGRTWGLPDDPRSVAYLSAAVPDALILRELAS